MYISHVSRIIFLQNLLNTVVERAPIIEQVNVNGGRYIREGKVNNIFETTKNLLKTILLISLG